MLTQEKTLRELFETHTGICTHKFPHHLDIYDRLFLPYKVANPEISILEIGIGEGGSLQLWRNYFGEKATIIGVDNSETAKAAKDKLDAKVLLGDQGSREFWDLAKPQIGRPTIIIDDGSHICEHQILTFNELFPLLVDGGLYVVEDIHTSYRENYGGGLNSPGSFVEWLKKQIDVIHCSESGEGGFSHIFSVQVYPNLAVIEKRSPDTWGGPTIRPAVRDN